MGRPITGSDGQRGEFSRNAARSAAKSDRRHSQTLANRCIGFRLSRILQGELEITITLNPEQKLLLAEARPSGISDAMEALGFRRAVIVGFRCATGGEPVIGNAFTIRQ